jgi:hypothetical protein
MQPAERSNDGIEILEAIDEVSFCAGGIFLTIAVGHRLSAAGLIKRILDRAAELFSQLQRRNADFGKKGVNVTGGCTPRSSPDRFARHGSVAISFPPGRT